MKGLICIKMTDYCWKKLPCNISTTILYWYSKQIKEWFFNFQQVNLSYREAIFLIYYNIGFSFSSGGCVDEVVDIRANCQGYQ